MEYYPGNWTCDGDLSKSICMVGVRCVEVVKLDLLRAGGVRVKVRPAGDKRSSVIGGGYDLRKSSSLV